jgi:hypothetical protein
VNFSSSIRRKLTSKKATFSLPVFMQLLTPTYMNHRMCMKRILHCMIRFRWDVACHSEHLDLRATCEHNVANKTLQVVIEEKRGVA